MTPFKPEHLVTVEVSLGVRANGADEAEQLAAAAVLSKLGCVVSHPASRLTYVDRAGHASLLSVFGVEASH